MLAAAGFCVSLGLASCEDYLTVLPTDKITEQDFWKDKNDLNNVRASAYRQFATQAVTDRIVQWGELRSDNLTLNDMSRTNIQNLQQGILMPTEGMFDWSAFYTGINYCNLVLEKGDIMTEPGKEVDPSFRRNDWNTIKAEMTVLRALYYFYLVRAYRDVPFEQESINTDEQARNRHLPATLGVNLLGTLIGQIEDLNAQSIFPAVDYGSTQDNCGRITKRTMYAILADMNLWRGCMLLKSEEKGDIVLGEEGDTLSSAECNALSNACFQKTMDYSRIVLDEFQADYDEFLEKNPNSSMSQNKDKRYPYLNRFLFSGDRNVSDVVYSSIWGTGYSDECIFQLNYNGVDLVNGTPGTFYSYVENNNLKTGQMVGSSFLMAPSENDADPATGFGRADIRLPETFNWSRISSNPPVFHKGLASSIVIDDMKEMSEGCSASWRSQKSMPWPLYRLSDIMLIRAEAIARLNPNAAAAAGNVVNEGFLLVNTLFERNNPKLTGTGGGDEDYVSTRLDDNYAYNGTAKKGSDLLTLVYQERQREFIGEGKRWFDIVRQVEASNDTKSTLSDFISLSTSVRNRLRLLYAMYLPIYNEEMKVNGVGNGGKLIQNPVWDRYTPNK